MPRAGKENITVLAVCSATGIALDPLIIFKGKHMQTTWYGDQALPNMFYGRSENGEAWKTHLGRFCWKYFIVTYTIISASGQLPPEENSPWLELGFGSRLGLVLGLGRGGNQTINLDENCPPPRRLGLVLVLGWGSFFLGGICLIIVIRTVIIKVRIMHFGTYIACTIVYHFNLFTWYT